MWVLHLVACLEAEGCGDCADVLLGNEFIWQEDPQLSLQIFCISQLLAFCEPAHISFLKHFSHLTHSILEHISGVLLRQWHHPVQRYFGGTLGGRINEKNAVSSAKKTFSRWKDLEQQPCIYVYKHYYIYILYTYISTLIWYVLCICKIMYTYTYMYIHMIFIYICIHMYMYICTIHIYKMHMYSKRSIFQWHVWLLEILASKCM